MSDEIAEFTVICFKNDTATDACLGMFKQGMFNSAELHQLLILTRLCILSKIKKSYI